jgi:hypothetical protein
MLKASNNSEQFVYDICQKSFLSLWSYVNPQGKKPNKELCDILVVFDPHIIVISVKKSELKNSGDSEVDKNRWLRTTIIESIQQLDGAIRFLNKNKNHHVVKKDGTLGIELPPINRRVYHRIAVAFGSRREIMIGSGGDRGNFTHVFEEQSFTILLQHLDTITDFVQYLMDKEAFLSQSSVMINGGEENLLAYYLFKGRQFPQSPGAYYLEDFSWTVLNLKTEFLAKLKRDQESYIWDKLIENICEGGFSTPTWDGPSQSESEKALRVLASENRFSRRVLGKFYSEFLHLSKSSQLRSRYLKSPSGIGYVFVVNESRNDLEDRKLILIGRCCASLFANSDCSTVIGIGTNIPKQKPIEGYSTDLIMLHKEVEEWPSKYLEIGRLFRDELGFFKNVTETHTYEDEYPSSS